MHAQSALGSTYLIFSTSLFERKLSEDRVLMLPPLGPGEKVERRSAHSAQNNEAQQLAMYCNMHSHVTQQDRCSSTRVATRTAVRRTWLERRVCAIALDSGSSVCCPQRRFCGAKTAGCV
jgi:hypothetical protein